MGSRQDYTNCMTPAMRAFPKGISRQERSLRFCAAAKVCSSKAKTQEEAMEICRNQPPKPPKERKARGKKAEECPTFDTATLIPRCEEQIGKMVKSGELPTNTDIAGICQLILG